MPLLIIDSPNFGIFTKFYFYGAFRKTKRNIAEQP